VHGADYAALAEAANTFKWPAGRSDAVRNVAVKAKSARRTEKVG
jgi:hypothetical protein